MYPRQPDNLLLVEDHSDIAEMLTSYFEGRGFALDYAADGLTGMHLAVKNSYDAIILDLMLPGLDGLSICEKLRQDARDSTPIIMLTARDTLDDKVNGLSSGADDYLVKPFALGELEARLKALLRRSRGQVAQERFEVGDLILDTGTWRVTRDGRALNVTPIGMKLLTVLMRASPQIVSRRQLEKEVWGEGLPDSDTLRSHLYTLRKAVDRPFEIALIETVSGAGYRIAPPEAADAG